MGFLESVFFVLFVLPITVGLAIMTYQGFMTGVAEGLTLLMQGQILEGLTQFFGLPLLAGFCLCIVSFFLTHEWD